MENCKVCSAVLDRESKFCSNCGTPVSSSGSESCTVGVAGSEDGLSGGTFDFSVSLLQPASYRGISSLSSLEHVQRTTLTNIVAIWTAFEMGLVVQFGIGLIILQAIAARLVDEENQPDFTLVYVGLLAAIVLLGFTAYRLSKLDNRFRIVRVVIVPVLVALFVY